MGPKVKDADFKVWVDTFDKMMATPQFAKLREERSLYPFAMTGAKLDAYVKERVNVYRQMAKDMGLNVAK